ncbi:S-layer homology domain-containing protein [Paenibacillus lignilyticus]|uniref:beta-galactosidase n=1 Tax=Paenibacillus lignilyticus TaxID=1172615 RepID=A0ABS5C918_9BACL|nr:S-layer homology domain-containing protein [Paenibacillus lignilyticus]MBP3962481.1 S-layer homology domain-containing protein [Paenibacillus lignilyticus]
MFRRINAIILTAALLLGLISVGVAPASRVYAADDQVVSVNPTTQEEVINGFENIANWSKNNADITLAADTANKTEGSQSLSVTYTVPAAEPASWHTIEWDASTDPIDLSTATQLKLDIRSANDQTTGNHEPIRFKLYNKSINKAIFEDVLPVQTANEWGTFTLNLGDIPAANRAAISHIAFYIYSKDDAYQGRTSLHYQLDNLRAVKPIQMTEQVVTGFEDIADWSKNNADITLAADTANKTEGSQSLSVTYTVPVAEPESWHAIEWDTSANPLDLSTATQLKLDIRSANIQTTGGHEPIRFKLYNKSINKTIFEDVLPVQTANEWGTFTLNLDDIPAANRAAISHIAFYIYSKDDAYQGRTSLHYQLDNLRVVKPADTLMKNVINGFEDLAEWGGPTDLADTVNKTEGAQAADVTYFVPDKKNGNSWVEYAWDLNANPMDLTPATEIAFDIRPVGSQTTGSHEPIYFKILDTVGNAIYEQPLPVLTADEWTNFKVDLTNIPAQKRAHVNKIIFYVFNMDDAIAGRTSLRYLFDNMTILTSQVQRVTATPGSSIVTPGTTVTLATLSVGANIFYTLDGSDPKTSTTKALYSAPIPIADVTTIKAYAEIPGKPKSAISVFDYTIGTGVPGEEIYGIHSSVADIGSSMLAGIHRTDKIGEDGFMNDWSGQASFVLPSNASKQVKIAGWGGVDDLSANAALAYDDNNLYLHVDVKDADQLGYSGDVIWRGDSVQVAFSKDGAVYGPEYGFSYGDNGTASKFSWNSGSAKLGVDSIKLKVSRDNTTKLTAYDLVIPWLAALPAAPGEKVPFTLLINDNDGADRRGYIEWTPGIGNGKDATSLGSLMLLDQNQTWSTWMHGPQDVLQNTAYDYSVAIANFGEEAETFQISLPNVSGTEVQEVTVPAHKVLKKAIPVSFPTVGNLQFEAVITNKDTGEAKHETIAVSVKRNAEALLGLLDEMNEKLPLLAELLATAKEQNIPVDYETVNYTVIKNFIQYGKDDITNNLLPRADYVVNELERLYDEATANVQAYLSGEKTALSVPRYVTARSTMEGFSFVGPTKTSTSDDVVNRPIFFTGYGHFNQAKADIPQFSDYGTNIIQMELGPDGTVLPPAEGSDADYSISTDLITNSVIPTLENAAEHNIAVSLLISPHYFPQWAKDTWPDVVNNDNSGFLKFNVNAPKAREIVEAYIKTLVPLVKDLPALHSIIISNEPMYNTSTDSTAQAPWHQFLAEKYTTIASLNENYGSEYSSFDDVDMPSAKEATPYYYDWTVFNNEYFSSWHQWMAELVKELAPDVPVSSKIMANLTGATSYGVDPEDFSEFADMNGNDNWNYLGSGISGFIRENRFYDLQGSFRKAPIFNSETHVIPDRDNVYTPEQANHVETSLWQSAVHGKNASAIWVWERSYDPNSDFYGSVLQRPDVVQTIGKVNLDLNRLANEVTELQNSAPQAAILYSLPSMVYSSSYLDAMDRAYEALTFNGQRVGFVSEKQSQAGGLSDYKLLIVPQATNVSAATLTAIKAFVAAGGKVIVIGENSLNADENNKPLNSDDKTAVLSSATVLGGDVDSSTLKQSVRTSLTNLGLMEVVLKDKATGQPIDGVEWLSTEYNGKLLINIANYDPTTASKTISIEVNGKPAGTAAELINGGTIDTGNLTVALEKPYLLSIPLATTSGGNAYIPVDQTEVKDAVIKVAPKLEGGKAIASLSEGDFAKALLAAKKDEQGNSVVTVAVGALKGTNGYVLEQPASLFSEKNAATKMAVQTGDAEVVLPLDMFADKEIAGAKTISLSISRVLKDGKPVVDISFTADGKAIHWNNPNAPVVVSIPYTPTKEELEHPEHIVIWYLDEAGHAIAVPNAKYDAESGKVVFTTTHFSKYAVAYSVKTFADEAKYKWALQAIEAVASKGILSGTSKTQFSPAKNITRADFVDGLVKALGLSAKFDSNFSDIDKSASYYESLGIAKAIGLSLGTGGNTFNPNGEITRQEMAALVVRAMKLAKASLTAGSGSDLKAFADASQIAGYAVSSVASLVKEGILVGDGGKISPTGHLTRAQAAVVLYRLITRE